jgi:hypothetical protein
MKAGDWMIRQIRKIGFPSLIQLGCTRHHLRTICHRERVRVSVLREYEQMIREYKSIKKKKNGCTVHGAES